MYIDSSNKLIIHSNDVNNTSGIISQLTNVSTLTIAYENTTKIINISNFSIDNVNIISVNLSNVPDNFFISGKTYMLYPCLNNTSGSQNLSPSINPPYSVQQFMIDNQLYNGFWVFILFIVIIMIYFNWGYISNYFSNSYFSKSIKKDNSYENSGGKIYYIGGYDYKDYLD
jgi:hypothetical protein